MKEIDTKLINAIKANDLEAVMVLVAEGADVNVATEYPKHTPLHFAAEFGDAAMVAYLASIGGNVDAADMWGKTPLDITIVARNNLAAVELLNAGANPNIHNPQETTLLFRALDHSCPVIVDALLKAGAIPCDRCFNYAKTYNDRALTQKLQRAVTNSQQNHL